MGCDTGMTGWKCAQHNMHEILWALSNKYYDCCDAYWKLELYAKLHE